MNLSKSLYMRGTQCTKSLWLKTHKPEKLKGEDKFAKSIFEMGNIVGDFACGLFPNGKKIPNDKSTFEEKISLTKKLIEDGIQNIYEATFEYDNILIMVDILHNAKEIYEVKSSTWSEKKSLKDIEKYIKDVSIQYYVLKGCGINIEKCFVTMINSNYKFQDKLELNRLFVHVDITNEVKKLQSKIPLHLKTFEQTLNSKEEPNVEISENCFKPYECDAYEYCWREEKKIPEYSVFDIFGKKNRKSYDLYEDGIINIEDIPNEYIKNKKQIFLVDSWINKLSYIDKEAIKKFIEKIKYPISYLDFETYMDAIPKFQNQKPFGHLCFQYSLHIEDDNGELEHKEFLAEESSDQREEFIKHLINDVPVDTSVIVYNASFEKSRIKELIRDFPQYKDELLNISDSIIDLAEPFQKKYYYDYRLKAKHSIKVVMPLLVPHMANAYKELELVQNGTDAINAFAKLSTLDEKEKKRYKEALLKYCYLDTLAMVEILRQLKKLV